MVQGCFIYISENRELSSDIGWWYQFVDGVQGVLNDVAELGFDGVKDHSMSDYLSAIEEWGDRPPND